MEEEKQWYIGRSSDEKAGAGLLAGREMMTPEAPLELTKPVWPTATHFLKHQDPWALTELGAVISRGGHSRKSNPKQGLLFFSD